MKRYLSSTLSTKKLDSSKINFFVLFISNRTYTCWIQILSTYQFERRVKGNYKSFFVAANLYNVSDSKS